MHNLLKKIKIIILSLLLFSFFSLGLFSNENNFTLEDLVGYWRAKITYTSGNPKIFPKNYTETVKFKIINEGGKISFSDYGYAFSGNPIYSYDPGEVNLKGKKITAKLNGKYEDNKIKITFNGELNDDRETAVGKCVVTLIENKVTITGRGNCELIKEGIIDTDVIAEAVQKKDFDKVKELIKKDYDINARYYNNNTLLMLSLKHSSSEISNLLIESGADINAKSEDGWTPLMFALRYNQPNSAKLIIDKGVEINLKNSDNWTPLMLALRYDQEKNAVYLIEHESEINVKTDDDWTPLMFALRYNQPKSAKLLIEKGADIDAVNQNNWTPLLFALRNGQSENAKLLIEKGANVNAATDYGWTPLMFALYQKQLENVKLLVEKGANINAKNQNNWTPMTFAVSYCPIEIIEWLKSLGAE